MGVERYLLAPMLVGLVAQRLVRRLCPHCKEPALATQADHDALGGALEIGARTGMQGKRIVVVVPDFAERYLSTPLFERLDR